MEPKPRRRCNPAARRMLDCLLCPCKHEQWGLHNWFGSTLPLERAFARRTMRRSWCLCWRRSCSGGPRRRRTPRPQRPPCRRSSQQGATCSQTHTHSSCDICANGHHCTSYPADPPLCPPVLEIDICFSVPFQTPREEDVRLLDAKLRYAGCQRPWGQTPVAWAFGSTVRRVLARRRCLTAAALGHNYDE